MAEEGVGIAALGVLRRGRGRGKEYSLLWLGGACWGRILERMRASGGNRERGLGVDACEALGEIGCRHWVKSVGSLSCYEKIRPFTFSREYACDRFDPNPSLAARATVSR